MKGTLKSFKKSLRETFEDAIKKTKKDEALDPVQLGMEPEDESASRERQQASGYLGAIDGTPDYGDDVSGLGTLEGGDEVEKEGVSQTKRSAHGYQLEDPIDYDLPGEPVQESTEDEEESDKDFPMDQEHDKEPLKYGLPTFGEPHPQMRSKEDSKELDPKLMSMIKICIDEIQKEKEDNPVSQEKAKTIMKHGKVGDKPLSDKQKGLFGTIAGGKKLTRSTTEESGPETPKSFTDYMDKLTGGKGGKHLDKPLTLPSDKKDQANKAFAGDKLKK